MEFHGMVDTRDLAATLALRGRAALMGAFLVAFQKQRSK